MCAGVLISGIYLLRQQNRNDFKFVNAKIRKFENDYEWLMIKIENGTDGTDPPSQCLRRDKVGRMCFRCSGIEGKTIT